MGFLRRLLPDGRGLPRAFWSIWVGVLINRIGGFVVPFLALYLTGERQLSVAEAGGIVAMVGLGSIGAGPIGGVLADRVGRRFTIGLSTFTGSLAMLGLGFASSPMKLALAALALGFFGDMYRPASNAMIADLIPPKDRPRAFGLIYWAVNLGFSIAPVLAGILSSKGFKTLFFLDAATTAAFGVLILATLRSETFSKPEKKETRGSLLTPYRDRAFLAFAALTLLVAFVFMQGNVALPVEMRAHGVSPSTYGMILSINGILIVVLQPFASSVVTRVPRGVALAFSAALTGIGFGVTGIAAGSIFIYAVSVVLWTLGEIAMAPITPTVVSDLAPPDLRGSYQGAFQMAFGGAAFLGPALGGAILGGLGSGALWTACVLLGIAAAIGFIYIDASARHRRARDGAAAT